MQKFVVKKSKSAPLASNPTSRPSTVLPNNPKPIVSNAASAAIPAGTSATVTTTKPAIITTSAGLTNTTNISLNGSAPCKVDTSPKTNLNSTSTTPTSQSQPAAHIKMSGYLKKKRNKVGGWRKLWFVLQNQLLLSYSSKEDYEKKLAPFKDVLNLVPGVIVRPTKGPRFTIETPTNLIFTYRCDNNKECSEWIAALLESLKMYAADNKLSNKPNKLHFSMDNLSKTRTHTSSSSASPASSFMSSRSCESIFRLKNAKNIAKLPSLTAANTKMECQNGTGNGHLSKPAQNFRLHPNETHVKQSCEVHRINRMFTGGPTKNTNHNIVDNKRGCANNLVKSHSHKSVLCGNDLRHHHHHHHHHHHRPRRFNLLTDSKITMDDTFDENSDDLKNGNLEDRFRNISLNIDHSDRRLLCERKTSASSSTTSDSSGTASTASASKFHLLKMNQTTSYNSNQLFDPNTNEPIYAVVNLKNKYEHRAKKKLADESHLDNFILRRERPNSFHVNSGEYEEVLLAPVDSVDGIDDENIYEPINIPELSSKGPLWKYFSKINIDALVEIARRRKETHNNDRDETTTFADIRRRFGQHRKSIKNRVKKLYNRSNGCDEHDKNPNMCNGVTAITTTTATPAKTTNIQSRFGLHLDAAGYFNRRDNHLFGSMLKKSRTSLTFDDSARKKFVLPIRTKATKNAESNGCHSKFYK